MTLSYKWSSLTLLGIMLGTSAGCSDGPQPIGVSGTVTFDGMPLPKGTVVFEPVSKTAGQRRDATIADGQFDLPTSEGILPDMEFKVLIVAFKKTGKKYPNADMSQSYDEEIQYLPANYNTASTLRAKISPDERENQLKFELSSR